MAPGAIRLAPPLVVTLEQLDSFVDALPALLDACAPDSTDTTHAPETADTPEDPR